MQPACTDEPHCHWLVRHGPRGDLQVSVPCPIITRHTALIELFTNRHSWPQSE